MPIKITQKLGNKKKQFNVLTKEELSELFGGNIARAGEVIGRTAELNNRLNKVGDEINQAVEDALQEADFASSEDLSNTEQALNEAIDGKVSLGEQYQDVEITEENGLTVTGFDGQDEVGRINLRGSGETSDGINFAGIHIQRFVNGAFETNFWADLNGNLFLNGNLQLSEGSVLVGTRNDPVVFISQEQSFQGITVTGNESRTVIGEGSDDDNTTFAGISIQALENGDWISNFYADAQGNVFLRGEIAAMSGFLGSLTVEGILDSSNYQEGSTGFRIDGNTGNTEFNNGVFRGSIFVEGGNAETTEGSQSKVDGLSDSLGNAAFIDSYTEALGGITLISGGVVQTELIDVEDIFSRNLILKDGGNIRSDNYSSGSSGFRIRHNGDAEFNNVTVRGSGSSVADWQVQESNRSLFKTIPNTDFSYVHITNEPWGGDVTAGAGVRFGNTDLNSDTQVKYAHVGQLHELDSNSFTGNADASDAEWGIEVMLGQGSSSYKHIFRAGNGGVLLTNPNDDFLINEDGVSIRSTTIEAGITQRTYSILHGQTEVGSIYGFSTFSRDAIQISANDGWDLQIGAAGGGSVIINSARFRVPRTIGPPSNLENGMIWYDNTQSRFLKYEDGSVSFL